jgi:hypothetical protein
MIFLLGMFGGQVYNRKQEIEERKNICGETANIPVEHLQRVLWIPFCRYAPGFSIPVICNYLILNVIGHQTY